MALSILEPGLLTTVQDLGREGYERYGVPVSGAMDRFALMAANLLVGNPTGAAGLEMALAGPTLVPDENCLIAVTGVGFELFLQNRRMPPWMAILAHSGDVLRLVNRTGSGWGYLAVSGGIDVPLVMGSRSTYLRGGFGGLDGRKLQAGDVLPIGRRISEPLRLAGRRLPPEKRPAYSANPTIEVVPGPQEEAFSPSGLEVFYHSEYQINLDSDRMGYRLGGPAVEHQSGADILSDGIVFGAIQVPANGQPIVMMSDRQTTGGYTKIGAVASVDLPLLAQCPFSKGRIRFSKTTVESAQKRYRSLIVTLREGITEADETDLDWASA